MDTKAPEPKVELAPNVASLLQRVALARYQAPKPSEHSDQAQTMRW